MSSIDDASIDWEAIDIAHQKIRLVESIAVWPSWENGRRVYRLENRQSNQFFRIGFREYIFISLLDGKLTVAAACGQAAAKLGRDALSQKEAESIIVWLLRERLATALGVSSASVIDQSVKQAGSQAKPGFFQRINPFWMQVPLLKDTRRLNRLLDAMGILFAPACCIIALAFTLFAACVYMANFGAVNDSAGDLFTRNGWLYLLITWVVLKVIHEFAHAAACRRQKGETGEMGIILILFAPLAYVDVTSCWRMPRVSSRMIVSAAGMYVELLIAAIAMVAWLYSDSSEMKFWLANVIVTAGVSTIAFNANPLMRFDGYYLLSDAIGIPNLYTEASTELKRLASWITWGDRPSGGHYQGQRRIFLLVYGLAALIWRILICAALCVTASVMFSGAGIVLAVFGIVAWFGKPLVKLIGMIVDDYQMDRSRFARSMAATVVMLVAFVAVVFAPIPTSVDAPAVVHDVPEAIVRCRAEGFVTQLHVRHGQYVRKGQLLVSIENETLEKQLHHLELERKEVEIQQRIAIDKHDASAEWIARRDKETITEKIEKLRPKVQSLSILAMQSGRVAIEDATLLVGRYVREGDEMMRVVNPQVKEVVATVHQNDVSIARKAVGQYVAISDIRRRNFRARIANVNPRASNTLADVSLAALYGGPLNVQRSRDGDSDESALRLLEPHFQMRADVEPEQASDLLTGTRVSVHLGHRSQSLLRRCQWKLREWIQTQQEMAEQG